MKTLEGKSALITGASRGIGLATAKLFAEEGAAVMLGGRSFGDLEAGCNEIKASGGKAAFCVLNVADEASVISAFLKMEEEFGGVDIVVNNAGTIVSSPIGELTADVWDNVINVNLRGTYLCSRQAFLNMKKGGTVINVSSLGGIKGTEKFPNFCAYTAAKSGVVGLTEALAVEGKLLGIRVNGIAPGAVNTAMLKKAAPHLKSKTSPEDVAQVLLFLADPRRSSTLNGAVIEIHSNL